MKKGIFKILYNIFIVYLLINSVIIPSEDNNNYCREAKKTEKELNEICKRSEWESNKNHKLSYLPDYTINKINFNHIFIVAHLIICHDTSFLKYVLVKEIPRRAPPYRV